jgi:hypothetical protein
MTVPTVSASIATVTAVGMAIVTAALGVAHLAAGGALGVLHLDLAGRLLEEGFDCGLGRHVGGGFLALDKCSW